MLGFGAMETKYKEDFKENWYAATHIIQSCPQIGNEEKEIMNKDCWKYFNMESFQQLFKNLYRLVNTTKSKCMHMRADADTIKWGMQTKSAPLYL